jgi:hypothetical protein
MLRERERERERFPYIFIHEHLSIHMCTHVHSQNPTYKLSFKHKTGPHKKKVFKNLRSPLTGTKPYFHNLWKHIFMLGEDGDAEMLFLNAPAEMELNYTLIMVADSAHCL